jgi:hypothetical protein
MSCAIVVRNISTSHVMLLDQMLLPGQTLELGSRDLLLDDELSDALRRAVDDGDLAVDPPEPETCH